MTPPLQVLTLMTGASSGIGKATALAFAKAGIHTALVSPSLEKLEEVASIARCSRVKATSDPLDLANQKPVRSGISAIASKFHPYDV